MYRMGCGGRSRPDVRSTFVRRDLCYDSRGPNYRLISQTWYVANDIGQSRGRARGERELIVAAP